MRKLFTINFFLWGFAVFLVLNKVDAQTTINCPIPVSDCIEHSTAIELTQGNICDLVVAGELDSKQSDCQSDDGNNCYEFIFTISEDSNINGFSFEVGTGSNCNGDVDEGYMSINNSECSDLLNSSSQTVGFVPFNDKDDVITLTYCKKGSSKITLCSFCTCSMTIDCSSVDATCGANGAVSVAVANDNGGLSYSWKNEAGDIVGVTETITGLEPDIYTVTVIDALGCEAVCSVEVALDCTNKVQAELFCTGYMIEGVDDPELFPSNIEENEIFTVSADLLVTNRLSAMGIAIVSDCDDMANMTLSYTNELSDDEKTLIRTWTLSDECSVIDVCVQEIESVSPLPVEFMYFKGSCNPKSVILEWATASELNNKLFAVERSFGREFERIGTVAGNGTTSEVQRYSFEDKSPNRFEAYYRLRQEDFDGTFEYSEIISLPECKPAKVQIFPNPVRNQLNLVLTDFGGIEIEDITIYDTFGRLINQAIIHKNGSTGTHFRVDVTNLTNGLYTLVISKSGSQKLIQKFVRESMK